MPEDKIVVLTEPDGIGCYNCGGPLQLDFYWIVNRNGEQILGVDIDLPQEGDEWIEFEICKNCHAAQ